MSDSREGFVATIVAGDALEAMTLHKIVQVVEQAGGQGVSWQWLDEGKAADMFCLAGLSIDGLRQAISKEIVGLGVDALAQSCGACRRKKALFIDMEATFIEQELLDDMARSIGLYDEVCAITQAGMQGQMDFAESLRMRVGLFKGQPLSLLDEALRGVTLSPGAAELVATMNAHGAVCALVSGGFTFFVEKVARQNGFALHFANRLGIQDGALSGEVEEPIFDKQGKRRVVEEVAQARGFALGEVACAGDGGNDVAMMDAVNAAGGLGVAWRGKAPLAHVPHQVRHSDLRTILYAQGYRREEIMNRFLAA